jgi:5-methylcytosine-specific restriction enzyme subunit McrC
LDHNRQHIRVFEHQSIKLGDRIDGEAEFDQIKLDALVRFFDKGVPYFSLIRNGVQFNEFVGAIQVGDLLISVLPKAIKGKQVLEEKTHGTRY